MNRRVLFALNDAGGTVPPELGVARRLVDRGHRITVLADESMADQVRRAGAAFHSWTVAPEEFRDWELRTPTSLARGMSDHMIAGPAPGHAVTRRVRSTRFDRSWWSPHSWPSAP